MALIIVLHYLFVVLKIAIIARVILSWVNLPPGHPLLQGLDVVVEPLVGPIRHLFGAMMGGLDFSPLIALIILEILHGIVKSAVV